MIESPWFPFFYQYLVGGAVFFSAILIAIHKEALQLSFKRDRNILFQLIAGFIFYAAFHGLMILLSGASNA